MMNNVAPLPTVVLPVTDAPAAKEHVALFGTLRLPVIV
jgi:hypothetical protein